MTSLDYHRLSLNTLLGITREITPLRAGSGRFGDGGRCDGDPDVLAQEIIGDLETALDQFSAAMDGLKR